MDGCAGDARLYDWEQKGYGIKAPVLWTARNGATISGHVWATKAGPAKRPGIVITNGSVQAAEQLYWFVAQTLAKAGYVVLTWDPQGQGQSDTRGETPDENEGTPAQSDGRPFFDGTVDALDFFFSNPAHPFAPRKSCASGTSHAAKQDRRVKAGLELGLQPAVVAARSRARRHRRALLRRRGRQLRRAVRPAREGGRRVGQPRRARPERRLAHRRAAVSGRPLAAHAGADHQARARHVGRLLHPAHAEHVGPGSAGEVQGVLRVLQGGRRHGRGHHPRRHPLRLRLDPQRRLPRDAARRRRDRLVHERLVRQVRQGRRERRRSASSPTAGATTTPRPPWTRTPTAT